MNPRAYMRQFASWAGKAPGAGSRAVRSAATRGMQRADPFFTQVGGWGGTTTHTGASMTASQIRRRGQFRVGVGAGAVGLASGVSGMRAKSSGGYTGANTY